MINDIWKLPIFEGCPIGNMTLKTLNDIFMTKKTTLIMPAT